LNSDSTVRWSSLSIVMASIATYYPLRTWSNKPDRIADDSVVPGSAQTSRKFRNRELREPHLPRGLKRTELARRQARPSWSLLILEATTTIAMDLGRFGFGQQIHGLHGAPRTHQLPFGEITHRSPRRAPIGGCNRCPVAVWPTRHVIRRCVLAQVSARCRAVALRPGFGVGRPGTQSPAR
jgi:hypothetical protein